MKLIINLVFVFCLHLLQVKGQDLVVNGIAPNLYLNHKVVAKESWFSVGRLYNINARELATSNNSPLEKGLTIAQIIKIPLTEKNTLKKNDVQLVNEFLVPFYHIVEKSEGLYRIANNAGISLEKIKLYNNLKSDVLNTGSKLIVGYLIIKKGESALITKAVTPPIEKQAEILPAVEKEPAKETVIIKDVPKKDSSIQIKQKTEPIVIKDAPKAPMQEVKELPENNLSIEGIFKKEYQFKEKKAVTGLSAVFKTTSGWTDSKYYALIDGVTSGTIIQITNKKNGKIVYAKVLGEMQEVKQNNGLLLRISNATANALNAKEETFEVQVRY